MGITLNFVNTALIFVVFALSLNILMGFAGQVSMMHAAVAGVGGYTAGYFAVIRDLPFFVTLPIGVAAAGLLGLLVSLAALRLAGEYLILLTLAGATVIMSLINTSKSLGGTYGLLGIGEVNVLGWSPNTAGEFLPLLALIAGFIFVTCHRLGYSPYGRVLRAIREDEGAARALGKNTYAIKMQVFGVTSAMAGLGGVLLVYYNQLASPGFFTIDVSIVIITMFVVGGTGNLVGSILGAALVVFLDPVLRRYLELDPDDSAIWRLVIYGLILILLMRFRPQGILPEGFNPFRHNQAEHLDDPRIPSALGVIGEDAHGFRSPLPVARQNTSDVRLEVPLAIPTQASVADVAPGEQPVLCVRGLRKSFGGLQAVAGVDLELPRHRVTGLIGPNGAGKSTLFGLFTGALVADEGTVELSGRVLSGLGPNRIAHLGMVRSFQDVRLFKRLTVLDNVATAVPHQPGEKAVNLFIRPVMVGKAETQTRAEALRHLEFVGMAHAANVAAGSLSYAEQKLVAIARVIATGAEVLLLDEPTSGVDPRWVDRVADAIRRLPTLGHTVCIVEHNLAFLEKIGAPCYFLETGQVTAHGELADLMGQERLRKAYFGV